MPAAIVEATAIFIFPLIRFLIFGKINKKVIILTCIMFFILIVTRNQIISEFTIIKDVNPIIYYKLKYFLAFEGSQSISQYFSSILVANMYLILILILSGFQIKSREIPRSNILLIIILSMVLSYIHPALAYRLLQPIYVILFGAVLFLYLFYKKNIKRSFLLTVPIVIFFQVKWTVFNEGYYDYFDDASLMPFYYFDDLLKENDVVDQFQLPPLSQVNRKSLEL